MSKADTWENGLLLLLFNNTAFAGVGDAGGLLPSSVAGSLYVSGHTADPGDTGTQLTNECTYGSYARVAVARSGAGFTVSANAVQFAANVTFPTGASGAETMTHWGLGTASSGAGKLLYKGTVTPNFVCGSGKTPIIVSGTNIITED